MTAWLVLLLIGNSAAVLMYTIGISTFKGIYPNSPDWAFPALALMGILNIVFLSALFLWKKWGFWGCVATYILASAVNLMLGLNVVQGIFSGLMGLGILYGVLQIEKKDYGNGWEQLE